MSPFSSRCFCSISRRLIIRFGVLAKRSGSTTNLETLARTGRQQVRDHFLGVLKKKKKDRLAQFLAANAGDPLDQIIDAYITPEGLAAIISDPAPIKNASSMSSLPGIEGARSSQVDWSKFQHAYFTGLRSFVVEHEGTKLRFRFDGLGWKLHELDLQLPEVTSD